MFAVQTICANFALSKQRQESRQVSVLLDSEESGPESEYDNTVIGNKSRRLRTMKLTASRAKSRRIEDKTTSKQLGNSSNFIEIPRQASFPMAGPTPIGVTAPSGTVQADYKGTEALKTCHSEFRHIPLMWTLKEPMSIPLIGSFRFNYQTHYTFNIKN